MTEQYIVTREQRKKLRAVRTFTEKYTICSIFSSFFAFIIISYLYSIISNNTPNNLQPPSLYLTIMLSLFFIFFAPLYTFLKDIYKSRVAVYNGKATKLCKSMKVLLNSSVAFEIGIKYTQSIIITLPNGKTQKLHNFKYVTGSWIDIKSDDELKIIYLKNSKIILEIEKR